MGAKDSSEDVEPIQEPPPSNAEEAKAADREVEGGIRRGKRQRQSMRSQTKKMEEEEITV